MSTKSTVTELTEDVEPTEDTQSADVPEAPEAQGRLLLSLDQILAAQDVEMEWVPIPEWAPAKADDKSAYGIYVRTLNGRERANWQQSSLVGQGDKTTVNFQQFTVKLVALAACDANGKRIFSETQANMLAQKSSKVLERLFDVASKLSGIGEKELEALGNSQPSDDSAID